MDDAAAEESRRLDVFPQVHFLLHGLPAVIDERVDDPGNCEHASHNSAHAGEEMQERGTLLRVPHLRHPQLIFQSASSLLQLGASSIRLASSIGF